MVHVSLARQDTGHWYRVMAILGCGVSSLVGILRQAGLWIWPGTKHEGHTLWWPQVRSSPHSSHPSLLTLMPAPVSKPHCPFVRSFARPLVVMKWLLTCRKIFNMNSLSVSFILLSTPYVCIVARQTPGWMMGCNLWAVCWAQFHCLDVATISPLLSPWVPWCDPWLVEFTNKLEAVI